MSEGMKSLKLKGTHVALKSGMDPYSRRATWNIIRSAREGRVVVLTTHFMDEDGLMPYI